MTSSRLVFALIALLLCAACSTRNEGQPAPTTRSAAPSHEPLIGEAFLCGGCDPWCSVVHDVPIGADLTSENASDIRFDLDADGLVLSSTTGSYIRRYDGLITCEGQRRPYWDQLYFEVETPDGTSVEFVARTAATADELETADPVILATTPTDPEPVNITALLAAAGFGNEERYFNVEAVLHSSASGESPVFRTMDLVYYCVCSCDVSSDCSSGCFCDEDCGI